MSRAPEEPVSHLSSEILDIIFSDEIISQGDLTRVARVSHDWHDAVTPLLWHTIHGLDCFMKLIPDQLWLEWREIQSSTPSSERPSQPLQLAEEDFIPIYQKMRFVKVIILDMEYADAGSDCYAAIVNALVQRPPSRCLFPNLRSLRFDICRFITEARLKSIYKSFLISLLSPRMTSENLGEMAMTMTALDFLSEYQAYTLRIITSIQQRYTHIEKVDLCFYAEPPDDLLARFARIGTLRTLDLHFGSKVRDCDLGLVTSASVPGGFANLEALGLHGLCAPPVARALRSWHFPSLWSFSTLPLFRADADQLHDILLAVHDHAARDTLRQLFIRPLIGRYTPLQMSHIQILSAFRRLTRVSLNATLGVLLTDDEHEQVAGWWPDIEFLEFNTATVYDLSLYQEDTPATTEALAHYARACPKLRDLSLPVTVHRIPCLDNGGLPEVPSELRAKPSTHPLSRLNVGDSPLDEDCVAQTTKFLRQLFPNLSHVELDENEWSMTWLDVRKALAKE